MMKYFVFFLVGAVRCICIRMQADAYGRAAAPSPPLATRKGADKPAATHGAGIEQHGGAEFQAHVEKFCRDSHDFIIHVIAAAGGRWFDVAALARLLRDEDFMELHKQKILFVKDRDDPMHQQATAYCRRAEMAINRRIAADPDQPDQVELR